MRIHNNLLCQQIKTRGGILTSTVTSRLLLISFYTAPTKHLIFNPSLLKKKHKRVAKKGLYNFCSG